MARILREIQPARRQDAGHPVERGRPHHRRRRDDAPAVARDVDPVAGAVFRKGRVEFEHVLEQDPARRLPVTSITVAVRLWVLESKPR